jgi:hypothetical protein
MNLAISVPWLPIYFAGLGNGDISPSGRSTEGVVKGKGSTTLVSGWKFIGGGSTTVD